MIVVADTSPLNYLIRIGAVDVLKPLYTHVLIPQTVAEELKKEKAPVVVKTWIAQPPEWLEVRPDPNFDPSLELLDPGEAAALSLAESLRADVILIDDLAGRTEAERRHLTVTGTLEASLSKHISPGCSNSTKRSKDSVPRISESLPMSNAGRASVFLLERSKFDHSFPRPSRLLKK